MTNQNIHSFLSLMHDLVEGFVGIVVVIGAYVAVFGSVAAICISPFYILYLIIKLFQ